MWSVRVVVILMYSDSYLRSMFNIATEAVQVGFRVSPLDVKNKWLCLPDQLCWSSILIFIDLKISLVTTLFQCEFYIRFDIFL